MVPDGFMMAKTLLPDSFPHRIESQSTSPMLPPAARDAPRVPETFAWA